MNHSIKTIAALSLCSLASASWAQDWYATADLGLNLLGDQTLEYDDGTGATPSQTDAGLSPSFAAGGRIGRYFGDRWRLEGEVMYRRNQLDEVSVPGLGDATGGDFASLGFGLSGLYEFNLFGSERYRTYAGAGVVLLQEVDIDFAIGDDEVSFQGDDVAAQFQAGIRYDAGKRWFLDVGLRYLIADDVEMEMPDDPQQRITAGYDPLTISAGFGIRF